MYLAGAWWLIGARGVEGAALAWTLRVTVDAVAMFVLAWRVAPLSGARANARPWALIVVSTAFTFAGVALGEAPVVQRAVLALVSTMTVLAFAWFGVASVAERDASSAPWLGVGDARRRCGGTRSTFESAHRYRVRLLQVHRAPTQLLLVDRDWIDYQPVAATNTTRRPDDR